MKLINRDTDYAVRALICLAKNTDKGKKIITVTDIVSEIGISRAFLRKIMQALAKKGLIDSVKGSSGGFRLKVKPEKIYLINIMEIFQGDYCLNECMFNKQLCPNRNKCILKKKIDNIEKNIKRELESINLLSLMNKNENLKEG